MSTEIKEGLSPAKLYNIAQNEAEKAQKAREKYKLLRWAYLLSHHAEYLTKTDKRTAISVAGMVAILVGLNYWDNDLGSFVGSDALAVGGGLMIGTSYHPVSKGKEKLRDLAGKFSKNILQIDNTELFKGKIEVKDVEKRLRKFPDVVPPKEVRNWTRGQLSQAYVGDPRIEITQKIVQKKLEQEESLNHKEKETSVRERTVELMMEAQLSAQKKRQLKTELNKAAFNEIIDALATALVFGGVGTAINIILRQYAITGALGLIDDFCVATPVFMRSVKRGAPIITQKIKRGVKSLLRAGTKHC